ncbi:MAG: potassium channel family protein [Nocardioides sp.]|uniref:potassium channel family protein n=1 Tax=Nocardioides sp. TaxID=35761 RepID=UPI0039E6A07F
MDASLLSSLHVVSWAVWAAFVADFLVRVVLAEQRSTYIYRHWYDVVLIALPMLRPLRLLRLLTFARVLDRVVSRGLVGRVTVYVLGAAVTAVLLGSLAELDAERGAADANITTFPDALWWAFTTVTTVGYGDRYPVTTQGRVVAGALMLIGIAVVGAVTAAIAAWFIEHLNDSGTNESA